MKASNLRIGNYVTLDNPLAWPEMKGIPLQVLAIEIRDDEDFPASTGSIKLQSSRPTEYYSQFDEFVQPIPLASEWLERFGAQSIPHFTVGNTKFFDLGRDRQLSVSCAGTPNCMVFLQDMENNSRHEGNNPIVLHNYDYNGPLYVHTFQNLFFALNGEELIIKQ